jgi:LCP family protein required for cell wall assembly
MFEHLDDVHPPAFDDRFRRAVAQRGRRLRRRRRVAGGAGLAALGLVAGAGGLYGRALWRIDDVDRVDVASTGPVAAGDPVTLLLVGTDGHTDGGEHGLTDTMLLARLDPSAGTAGLLSLPRDLLVTPPGGGDPTRLDEIWSGGWGDLVAVVESQIGVPVDHMVEIDMNGFRSLVDRLGGLEVWFDAAVRDEGSGLFVDELGCVALDGEQALALVRSRKVEVLDEGGAWVRDALSDLRRLETQRQVVLAALASLAEDGVDPVTLDGHAGWAVENLTVDSGLGVRELVALARAAAGLDPATVFQSTLPVVPHPDDPNRLAIDTDAAPAVVEAFTTGRPSDPPAAGAGPTLDEPPPDGALPGGAIVDPCP